MPRNIGRVLLRIALIGLAVVVGLPLFMIALTVLMSSSGVGIPMDPWHPKDGERIGAFVLILLVAAIGVVLLVLAGKLRRPNVVSLAVSRIWAVGALLLAGSLVLLGRNLWLLVVRSP